MRCGAASDEGFLKKQGWPQEAKGRDTEKETEKGFKRRERERELRFCDRERIFMTAEVRVGKKKGESGRLGKKENREREHRVTAEKS